MTTAAVAFALAFLVSLVLTPLVRALAVRQGVLDQARSSRKIHERPIPRLGGVAIVLAFFAPLVGLYFVESGVGNMFFQQPRSALGIFAGGLAIALLGVYDDLIGSGAGKKFAVQFGVFREADRAEALRADVQLTTYIPIRVRSTDRGYVVETRALETSAEAERVMREASVAGIESWMRRAGS